MAEPETPEASSESSDSSLLGRLLRGDLGLAKTYWLFGVLGGALFIIPAAIALLANSVAALILVLVLSLIYSLIVAIGTWRASDKYRGGRVWPVLAKIAVIAGVLWLLIDLLSLYSVQAPGF